MKYGIIGTGWIAESFIEGARLLCNADITSVYSRTEEKGNAFAERNNIPYVYTSLEEFSKADFEAVYIASPNLLHFSQSVMMLNAGKNVICEKPITVYPYELEECIKLADKKNLIYLEAIMYMHSPNREKLREAVKNIGTITSAHIDFSQLSSKYAAYKRGETPNIFNPELATGCLMDLGIYCYYPVIDLFGMPDRITADASFLRTGSDGSGTAVLNYGDKLITLTYSKTGQNNSGSNIYGDLGTINANSISKLTDITLTDNSGNTVVICPDMPKAEIMGYEALEFEKFISDPGDSKYKLCKEMSMKVSSLMEEIRILSGIQFK